MRESRQTYATYLECFRKIAKIVNAKPPQKETPPQLVKLLAHRWISASKKAEEELGYRSVPLDETLNDCWQWMLNHLPEYAEERRPKFSTVRQRRIRPPAEKRNDDHSF